MVYGNGRGRRREAGGRAFRICPSNDAVDSKGLIADERERGGYKKRNAMPLLGRNCTADWRLGVGGWGGEWKAT